MSLGSRTRRSSDSPDLVAAGAAEPLRQICRKHPYEWLLVKILDPSAPAGDGLCLLLAHGHDWRSVYKASRQVRKGDCEAALEILHGGTTFGDGAALCNAISRISATDEWISVNRW